MSEQAINITSGFYNSINGDRTYSANDMNKPYKRVITEGIFATPQGTPSTDFQVLSANNAMNIIVKKGEGLLGNRWIELESDTVITVTANTGITPRRDSIIVRVDNTQSGRVAQVIYREGIASSNPMPPNLVNTDTIKEIRVANIYVAAGATWISQDAITDLRGSGECPWITSLIKQVDTSTLYAQWQKAYQDYYDTETAAFNAFMESLTQQLTVNTNVVTYESHYTSATEVTEIPINIATFDQNRDVLMVFVNRLRATPNTDYTIATDNSKITLTNSITTGQSVNFLVLKSIVGADAQTIEQELTAINNAIAALKSDTGWINFTLENGTSFDDTTKPAVRKYNNQVFIRGAIKGLNTTGVAICTLPTNMRPAMNHQYTAMAISDGGINASCVIEITTAGIIKLVGKSGTISSTAMLPISTNFIVG
mgnify:CR=1 FL=1